MSCQQNSIIMRYGDKSILCDRQVCRSHQAFDDSSVSAKYLNIIQHATWHARENFRGLTRRPFEFQTTLFNGQPETLRQEEWVFVIRDIEELIINADQARNTPTSAQEALYSEYIISRAARLNLAQDVNTQHSYNATHSDLPPPPPPILFSAYVAATGQTLSLSLDKTTSFGYLKYYIQRYTGVPFSEQKLRINDTRIRSELGETLENIGLRNGQSVCISRYKKRDARISAMDVMVKLLLGRTITLGIPARDDEIPVNMIMDMIQERENIPPLSQRLTYQGITLNPTYTLSEYDIQNESCIYVIRLRGSPAEIDVTVRLALPQDWRFSDVYPVVPTQSIGESAGQLHEEIVWNVRTHADGSITETNTGLDVACLSCEVLTNSSALDDPPPLGSTDTTHLIEMFRPIQYSFDNSDSVVVATSKITPYLDETLKVLGLDTEAQTSFITYWLPDLMKHEYVALRFIRQDSYSPLTIYRGPDVVTRVFMVFRKVAADELGLWENARLRSQENVAFWREVVGVESSERQADLTLFRVLMWGGMEVI